MTYDYNNIRSFAPIHVNADLRVTCETGTIDITADGKEILVHFSSLRVAIKLLRMLSVKDCFADTLKTVDQALKRMDVTLFWQSSLFGILGSKGRPFLRLALIGIQKII
ncbi:MAG: hypothetical protein OER74_16970 [Desulfobacteraceae bacterium]|jgi:hypothetical protein|nr:hypothetical protein [Desulfobacteraceae bacterium]